MENTLTKQQAETLLLVTRQWKDHVRLILGENDYNTFSEWLDKLHDLDESCTGVNLYELYYLMNDLSVYLSASILRNKVV